MKKVVPRKGSSFFGFGVAQHNRAPKTLDPDYVRLDDRPLHELIAYSAELSKYVKYFNLENEEDGSWEPFFNSDISVNIAQIIATDLRSIDMQSTDIINNFYKSQQIGERAKSFVDLYKLCIDILYKFNLWHDKILKLNLAEKRFESQVEFELYNIISDKVKTHYHHIYAYQAACAQIKELKEINNVDFSKFNIIWEQDDAPVEDVFYGKTTLEKITSGMLSLRLQYRFIFQALNFTVDHFKRYFENSLLFKDNHNPDISLFISFLKVFGNVQDDYNSISERLQYFYYRDYLKLNPNIGSSDQMYMFLTLADNVDRHFLPVGTQFEMGTVEDGRDIVFEMENDLEVTEAEIKQLKTIYCSRLDDLDTSNYKLTSHIYTAPVANSLDGQGTFQEIKYSWPLFGEEQEYKSSEESNMILANVGWAFSSPVLYLKEGNRKVTVRLDFLPESTRIFKRLVYDIYLKVNKDRKANEPAKILTEIFYDRIFNQVDKQRNFNIFLSSTLNWLEVNPNTITVKAVGDGDWVFDTEIADEDNMGILNALEISFTLPNAAAPITSFNPEIHLGPAFDTFDPVIKFLLNDKKQPFAYSFLQSLELDKVAINVSVDRVKHVNVFDEFGNSNGSKNLYPFGIEPNRGTICYFGVPELFKKHLTDVAINVDWDRIPETVEDFVENYAGYETPLHPAEVKVQIGALTNYEIANEYDEELEYEMFSTTEGNEEILPATALDKSEFVLGNTQLALLNILPNYDLPYDNIYADDVDTGFFTMEIVGPRNALYSNIYQNEVQQAINKNINNPEEDSKFPKPAVIPYIKAVTVSYSAEAAWSVAHGDVNKPERNFHIHPYGVETSFADGSLLRKQMLPKYNDDGYLYIGLENVKAPETISLFFELTSEDTADQSIKTVPKITWVYLSENRWIPFADSKLIFDTTYGFTETGIVRLQIPFTITNDNTIFENGLFWIGARILGDVNKICKVINIKTNAVITSWKFDAEMNERIKEPIQPNSVVGFVEPVDKIKTIDQPYASFGGRAPEDVKVFNTRISEQLRHKNRIVTHWDIERISLELFPYLYQAKVLSYLSDPIDEDVNAEKAYLFSDEGENEENFGINHQEGVKLVVIPEQNIVNDFKTPKLSLYRLQSIQTTLEKLVSPFMKLHVINPKYEYLRVIANVKFIENFNNGMTLNRLFEDINSFIAPWMYGLKEEVRIGGNLSENVLQNYIKGLDYVKFLTKFSLLHIVEEDGLYKLQDTAMEQDIVSIIQARPWGVLIPDDIHEIDMIEYEEEELPVPRVNSDQIIRFQNKVNILGDKKYIKVKNSKFDEIKDYTSKNDPTSNFTISF